MGTLDPRWNGNVADLLPHQGRIQKFHLGATPQARGSRCRKRREGGVWGGGVPLPTGEGSGEEAVPPPQKFFFQYCIIKWPVLVDSDVLHVLLIVVVKLETCT